MKENLRCLFYTINVKFVICLITNVFIIIRYSLTMFSSKEGKYCTLKRLLEFFRTSTTGLVTFNG